MSTVQLAQELLTQERENIRATLLSNARRLEANRLLEWSRQLDENPVTWEEWKERSE